MTPGKDKDEHAPQIDLDEVARLIEALERDLNSIQGGSKDIQRLRDEVETLKNVLRSPVRRHHWVRGKMGTEPGFCTGPPPVTPARDRARHGLDCLAELEHPPGCGRTSLK